MHGSIAQRAEADEILFRIFALLTAVLDVMDFEVGDGSAPLASPTISFRYLPT